MERTTQTVALNAINMISGCSTYMFDMDCSNRAWSINCCTFSRSLGCTALLFSFFAVLHFVYSSYVFSVLLAAVTVSYKYTEIYVDRRKLI